MKDTQGMYPGNKFQKNEEKEQSVELVSGGKPISCGIRHFKRFVEIARLKFVES